MQGFGPAYPLVLFLAQEKNEKNIHLPQGPSLYGGDATAPPVAQTFRYARTIKGPAWFFIGYRTE